MESSIAVGLACAFLVSGMLAVIYLVTNKGEHD
jgi:hypothetical protein